MATIGIRGARDGIPNAADPRESPCIIQDATHSRAGETDVMQQRGAGCDPRSQGLLMQFSRPFTIHPGWTASAHMARCLGHRNPKVRVLDRLHGEERRSRARMHGVDDRRGLLPHNTALPGAIGDSKQARAAGWLRPCSQLTPLQLGLNGQPVSDNDNDRQFKYGCGWLEQNMRCEISRQEKPSSARGAGCLGELRKPVSVLVKLCVTSWFDATGPNCLCAT